MGVNAVRRRALITAAGLLVCFSAAPALSAEEDAATEPSGGVEPYVLVQKQDREASRRTKKAHHKPSKVVLKSNSEKQANARGARQPAPISAAVANASAELRLGDSPAANIANATSARATIGLAPGADKLWGIQLSQAQMVSADQLNDIDRALHESPSAGVTVARAAIDLPAAAAVTVAGLSSEGSSVWQKSSTIGKIFIGFGALLTMASAARMFMT